MTVSDGLGTVIQFEFNLRFFCCCCVGGVRGVEAMASARVHFDDFDLHFSFCEHRLFRVSCSVSVFVCDFGFVEPGGPLFGFLFGILSASLCL